MTMERRIKLKTLNSHITCKICRGYFIDATTVTECLHTFCKSCLVKHLEENNTCPTCSIVIHQSHPLQYISFDRTMQDIVYKLVPDLQDNELKRERDFYRARGLPCPKDAALTADKPGGGDELEQPDNTDCHRKDEQVNICLECISTSLRTLKRSFVRCSAQATITHLKKFVAKKVLNGIDKYRDIDILCNDELLEIFLFIRPNNRLVVKLGAKTVERFLSLADDSFIEDVNDDLRCFIAVGKVDRVLVFPPVSNYRRFLIHRCVEQFGRYDLATFSIGVSDERRTVVCYREKLLSDEACARPTMGLTQTEREDASITQDNAAVGGCKQAHAHRRAQPQEKISRTGSTKPRRPDRAVYVPRALRTAETSPLENEENKPEVIHRRSSQSAESVKCPKSPAPRDKSANGTPRKSLDKNFCNVYVPPHLRNQRSHTGPCIADQATSSDTNESVPSGFQVPNSDSAIPTSDNRFSEVDVSENFYIGDYFANGQLGFYSPNYYSEYEDSRDYQTEKDWRANESDDNMAVNEANQSNIIDNDYLYNKDEDVEKNELKRASQEINRSSKRIIKQSFDSDVLLISDPGDDVKAEALVENAPEEKEPEPENVKPKLEPKVSLKREENDWDAVFDDSGECLDPSLLEELTSTVGKVHISKAKNNYEQYQTRGQALFNGPYDETFGHVVEVYDFPSEFKTNDLFSLFSEYKDTGFEIKWVDDTHALIVFSSAKIAAEVLSAQRPLVRCRPLHAATLESRNKAKKCAEFLQPYRQRPETCTALARRLVSGALGVKLSTARQERAEERRLITIAREKKRQAALHKEAAWDGSLANHSVADT
ncbi:hypothetical protein K1T71_012067 [Dendrolimus kikuchii]|uniref:Uncharacterized protein n=1 Tax=Dendrolimus kikuchii TaxID=765133 RepID=A0ACC1CKI0_9NEOP|nr:hypothetical protein K1T71_012067 [Dendrolimus kikuchii]